MSIQRNVRTLVMALAFSGFAGLAGAQEFRSAASAEPRLEGLRPKDHEGLEASLSVQGRCSILSGVVDPFIGVNFGNLFGAGLGVVVEADLLGPVGPDWQLGAYLSAGWDHYEGTGFTDVVGDTLTPDRMDLVSIFVGMRAVLDLGNHFRWESHVGLGGTHNAAVNGVLVTGGVPTPMVVFGASTQFAVDLGTRLLFDVGSVFFDVGLGLRTQMAPANGGFVFLSEDMTSFAIEFGVGIRF